MTERNRLLLLIAIISIISLIVGGISVYVLYQAAVDQQRSRMVEIAQSQARLIEAMARHDIAHNQKYHKDFPQSAEAITLSKITDAHEHYQGFGQTGEFVLAKRAGDNIVFLLRHRHDDLDFPEPIPFTSTLSEPMRHALSGQSGSIIGLDYRGVEVLAAYEPVEILNFGIVAKIDLKEIQGPFLEATLHSMMIASLLVFIGAWLFFKITNPIVHSLAEHKADLEKKVEQRTIELTTANSQLQQQILDRKQAEEKFRGILRSVPDAMVIIDETGKINLANNQAEQLFGYTRDELIGKPIEVLLPSHFRDSHVQHRKYYYKKPTVRPMGKQQDLYAQDKNGRRFAVEVSLGPIYTEEEIYVVSTVRDITARREVEQALQEAKEVSESANLAKTQFLTNMSHEIRTPLNAIVGFSQILLNRGTHLMLPDDFEEFLYNIKLSGQNLSELINNILDLAKIEAGKMEVSEETLDLPLLIQGIYHINKAAALRKGLKLSYDFDPQLPVLIDSDRTKLNQILMNLTSNAIKFTPPHKKVEINAYRQDHQLLLEVRDYGIGIPEDRHETIFDAFEQLDASATRHHGGTGLGLAITKKMVELLGGNISLKSQIARGSSFHVRIPLKEASSDYSTAHTINLDNLSFSKDNRILLIEDNKMNQQMINALFQDFGLKIHIANNGKDGVEQAQQSCYENAPFDLILMDMHMPGIDGIYATQQIRMHPESSNIPIIALSAEAFHSQQQEALKAGVSAYLTKPLEIEKLIPLLKQYLKSEGNAGGVEKYELKPLPKEIEEELLEEFEILANIPSFLSNEIVQQTKKMMKICRRYDSPYFNILTQIEESVFSRKSKQLPLLIDKVLNGKHIDC
ncbi:MAG: PAS domain S-box protein [SAR324 cluster bacterium]|nr:PAS domain S-box protein [SAR324 cluster bacterium]